MPGPRPRKTGGAFPRNCRDADVIDRAASRRRRRRRRRRFWRSAVKNCEPVPSPGEQKSNAPVLHANAVVKGKLGKKKKNSVKTRYIPRKGPSTDRLRRKKEKTPPSCFHWPSSMVFLFKASYDKKKSLKIALGPDLKGEIKGETKIQWVFQGSMRKRALIDSSLLSSKKNPKDRPKIGHFEWNSDPHRVEDQGRNQVPRENPRGINGRAP